MSPRLVGRTGASIAAMSLLALLTSVRCANVNRGLGEACIRNEDCLSNVCAGQECIAAPTTFDATTAATTKDAGVDAASDAASDASADVVTPKDTGTPPHDAGLSHDAHADASDAAPPEDADQVDAGPTDAGAAHDAHDAHVVTHDSGSDVAVDAHTAG